MSDTWLIADPVLSLPLLYGILISLSGILMWMEWRRQSPYLPLRIIACLLMMVALAGFLFRPLFKTQTSEQIILLTPRYERSQVDSLLDLYPAMDVFHTADAKPHPDAAPLKSYHDLSAKEIDVSFIVGQGLPPGAIALLESDRYQFIPSAYPEGIIRITIPDQVVPDRPALVEGIYNTPSKELKLFLSGPGGKEDSVTFRKNGLRPFKLSFLPKEPGNFTYTLHSENSVSEKLPIRVQEKQPLDILFIQHYPTFETRYLKEFLGHSHRLVLRYQLSKNKYRHEFVNSEQRNINQLTKASLSNFDLLIIDSDALQTLSAPETRSLWSAVEEGLGVLALFNSSPAGVKKIIPFSFARHRRDTAHLSLARGNTIILPAWRFSVVPDAGIIAILRNRDRMLSGYRYRGLGKTGFQLLQETYRLRLQGDSIAYGTLWSQVLGQISQAQNAEFAIDPGNKFPLFSDSPIPVEIISSGNVPLLSVNGIRLPLKESVLIDDLWQGKFWTGKQGWNKLVVNDGPSMDVYISGENEWQSMAITNALDHTRQAASAVSPEKELKAVFRPVPEWVFFLLFLSGAGFLWLAPKL